MPVAIVTHTGPHESRREPTEVQPVTMIARDLASARSLQPHSHDCAQLTLALEGVIRLNALDSSWIVPPQRAIWTAPNVEHSLTVIETARLRPVYVASSFDPFPGEPCKVLTVSPLLRELVMALEQEDPEVPSHRSQLIGNLILDELPKLATRPIRVPMPRDKRLRSLCDSLLAEPGSPQTLEQWAHSVGASERTLARLFEKELGMSFGQWRQQARLAHAAPLIASGMPLAQVADALGYASQSAFTAMFRKTFGVPPTEFFARQD
ncbi:helix-turn-helix transcriptional regulator [Pseudoduganella sp.]|uniref:AraC family transcriptional regulator n=1 Tax=Pseudoduganella sp. TaxID=1880898 RepID=UPI0035AF6DEE